MITLFQKINGKRRNRSQGEKKKRSYVRLLEFRCRGKLIYSAKTDSLGDVVKIGRAPDNDWIIPDQDRVSADYQAELRLEPGEIRLLACGKNRFRVHGKAVAGHILKVNDRIAVGDCELFVKPAEVREQRPCDVHRLEFQNGPHEGELIRLEKNLIRIGSAPENDIVIKDDVVSRFHAEIRIAENGESWIRDLDSINGTFVNGAKLGRQERMLMDSDEISISFFDFIFLDRNVPHIRSQIGRKILIMGMTVVVILAFFGVFYAATPQAAQVLNAAEYYIRHADFDAAQRMLDRMPESREYQKYEKHHFEHLKNIARYKKTLAAWHEFQGHLKEMEWRDAAECFGRLEIDNRFAWNWDDATVDKRMALVRHAKALLDVQFKIRTLLSSMDSDPETQRELLDDLKKNPLLVSAGGEPEWLLPLHREIGRLKTELENNCRILDRMTAALDRLNGEKINFKQLVAEIDQQRAVSSGSVRVRAQDLSEVLKALEVNSNAVGANQEALIAMDFDRIKKDILFVSLDECMISPQIIRKRNQLIQRQDAIIRNAGNLKYLLKKMKSIGLGEGRIPEIVGRFTSEKEIMEALRFECLKEKMPNARRKTPFGKYDRMFGIRFFYEIIQQSAVLSTNLYSDDIVSSLDFRPDCIALASLYRVAEETNLWLSLPGNRWMLDGRIAGLKRYCENLLERRSDMLAMLNRIAATTAPDTGRYFVAKAAFFYFSPASTISRQEMRQYAAAWKLFRRKQQSRIEKYDPLKLQEAGMIENDILANGIPGDSVVNWIWSQKK